MKKFIPYFFIASLFLPVEKIQQKFIFCKSDHKFQLLKKILKDEYQDMLQDYAVIYDVELSVTANRQLIEKLKTMTSADAADQNCKWYFADNGFSYKCEKERTMYLVNYDTIKRIVSYKELAD